MLRSFEVANVKCGACANTIIKHLTEAGFEEVSVDLLCEPRKVTSVIKNAVHEAQFREMLTKLGYPMADEDHSVLRNVGLKAKSFISCATGKFELSRDKNN
jgi:copper chaperone CopZ